MFPSDLTVQKAGHCAENQSADDSGEACERKQDDLKKRERLGDEFVALHASLFVLGFFERQFSREREACAAFFADEPFALFVPAVRAAANQ